MILLLACDRFLVITSKFSPSHLDEKTWDPNIWQTTRSWRTFETTDTTSSLFPNSNGLLTEKVGVSKLARRWIRSGTTRSNGVPDDNNAPLHIWPTSCLSVVFSVYSCCKKITEAELYKSSLREHRSCVSVRQHKQDFIDLSCCMLEVLIRSVTLSCCEIHIKTLTRSRKPECKEFGNTAGKN